MEIRNRNKVGPRLTESTCIFRTYTTRSIELCIGDPYIGAFKEAGGEVSSGMDHRGLYIDLVISHAIMDAFGGLYVLSHAEMTDNAISSAAGEITICAKNNVILSKWSVQNPSLVFSKNRQQTFTQNFINALLKNKEGLPSVDICVACESLMNLDTSSICGNSFGLVKVDSRRLKGLSSAPREKWSEFLTKRAIRSLADTCQPEATSPSPILISSLGDLRKIPWVSGYVSPENLVMFPTPIFGSINIILWSVGDTQVITVGTHTDCALSKEPDINEIVHVWESLIC